MGSTESALITLKVLPEKRGVLSHWLDKNYEGNKENLIKAIDSNPIFSKFIQQLAINANNLAIDKSLLIDWLDVIWPNNLSLKQNTIDGIANQMNDGMTALYLLLNTLGFSLSLTLALGGNPTPMVNHLAGLLITGQSWNHFDSIGGFIIALKELKDNHLTAAALNAISSCQLLSFTLAGIIGLYITKSLSVVVASSFLSFSFALAMMISAGLELHAINQLDKTITQLNSEKSSLSDLQDDDLRSFLPASTHVTINPATKEPIITFSNIKKLYQTYDFTSDYEMKETNLDNLKSEVKMLLQKQRIQQIDNMIAICRAKKKDHINNFKVWAGCALAMTAIAVVSVFSLGSPVIALTVCAGFALISGLFRSWYQHNYQNMHLNAEKNALIPPQPGLNPSSFFKEKLNSTDNASVPDNQDINSETSSLFELIEEDTSDSNSCNSTP